MRPIDADALKEKKEEEYGSLAIIRIPFDSELNDLKRELEASEKDLERTNEKLEKLSGVKEELLKAQEEREEKRRARADEIKSKGARRIRKDLEKLPNDLRLIAYTLDDGYGPSYLFKDPKKPTSAEKRAMRELINARKALSTLEPGSPKAVTVRVHGHFVRFLSDQFGNLMMQSEGHSLSLSLRGDQIADNFSKDVFERPEIYEEGDVREIIESQKTDLSSMNRGELLRTREYCARVLRKKTGIAMNLLNNVPVSELKNAALIALDKNTDRKKLISTFTRYVERQNTRHRDVHINTVLNLELQKVGKGSTDGVKLLYEDMEEKSGWREEEELVRDFAADLLFSEDTWVSDGMKKEPALRMRSLLLRHSRAISLIISDQFRNKEKQPEGLVTGMVEKLPIFAFSEGGGDELKGKLEEALEQVRAFVEKMVDARIKETNSLIDDLESKLSEAGAISQIAAALTCMTTGAPGAFETPWGIVEFTHTDREIDVGRDTYRGRDDVLEATVERAARDLRRVGRNVDLIDHETLAEVISEERNHEQQGVKS